MTFLNPLLLFGMAAIAAPIIIHMFMNRRIKRVVWAAMQFLQASVQKNQKRMEIEDLLLLALRCLILILLALALARPIIGRVADAGAGKGGETAVIAIDNSANASFYQKGGIYASDIFSANAPAAPELARKLLETMRRFPGLNDKAPTAIPAPKPATAGAPAVTQPAAPAGAGLESATTYPLSDPK